MQSANLSGPLKGLRPYQALIGPTQASGLAGGFDWGPDMQTRGINGDRRSQDVPSTEEGREQDDG